MKKQLVRFEYKVLFCLHKNYLDTGFGLLNYVKYFLYAYAGANIISTQSYSNAFVAGFIFLVVCYFLGYGWYHTDMARASAEIGNRYNLFIEEMRKKYNLKKTKQ